jgi:hypothetical protein
MAPCCETPSLPIYAQSQPISVERFARQRFGGTGEFFHHCCESPVHPAGAQGGYREVCGPDSIFGGSLGTGWIDSAWVER